MTLTFSILGEPMGKQRPKFSRQGGFVKTYTSEKTANYEQWVRLSYMQQHHNARFSDDDYISADITAYYGTPKSTSKKRLALMHSGEMLPTKKPDLDNIAKIILDSLNGIAYKDDAQVVFGTIRKLYIQSEDESPRVEVTLTNERRTP